MNIFVSYKFTGEDPKELEQTFGVLCALLRKHGNTVYCSIEDESWYQAQKRTNKEIMDRAFTKIDECDMFLAVVRSNEKSEGMLVEIRYAMAKKKTFMLALKSDVKTTSIHQMADGVIEFEMLDDLLEQLEFI